MAHSEVPVRPPLRDLRRAHGKSLRAQAKAMGMPPQMLSRIERGEVTPTLPTLHRIAVSLELSELEALIRPWIPNLDGQGFKGAA